ncbi:MAG: hypothetical protein ACI4TV_07675, partial [Paludibacteraceae bacterium]
TKIILSYCRNQVFFVPLRAECKFCFVMEKEQMFIAKEEKLPQPKLEMKSSIRYYRYVYVMHIDALSAGGDAIGVVTYSPVSLINGLFMERGYAILPDLNNKELLKETMVVSYAEVESSIAVTVGRCRAVLLHIRDAQTAELLCSCRAEGANVEASIFALQNALERALDAISQQLRPLLG